MNIFILDLDPVLNAQYYVNKHIVKMPLESSQLLCSAHHMTGTDKNIIPYKLTHPNHPSAKWTRQSIDNYFWLCKLSMELCLEYTYRYGKRHACQRVVEWSINNLPRINETGLTPFALAMPDEYKCECPVKSYRNYYNGGKKHLFVWTKREVPHWIGEINEKI
jgi:hypothetical protein